MTIAAQSTENTGESDAAVPKATSNKVLVVHLWQEPDECAMCEAIGYHEWAVPWYCGPVAEGHSEGGYKTTCKPCPTRSENIVTGWPVTRHHLGTDG